VDSTPPVISLDAEVQAAVEGQIIGPMGDVLSGSFADAHSSGTVHVCREANGTQVCDAATMFLTTQAPTVTAYTYDDVPVAAVDLGAAWCGGGEVTRTFVVGDDFAVGDVDLGFTALHPNREELAVDLISPAGDAVRVIAPSGETYGFANYDVWLDDAATGDLHNLASDDGVAPYFDRTARPDGALSAFNGTGAQGTWTLRICDLGAGINDGAYQRARLSLTPQSAALPVTGTWTYDLPLIDGADGLSQTLNIYAVDSVGNRTATAIPVHYWLDIVSPALEASTYISQTVMGLTGTATDGGGLDEVYAWGVAPDDTTYRETVVREGTTWSYVPRQTISGTHTLWVEAYDMAGNLSTAGPFAVSVFTTEINHVYLPLVLRE